MRSPERCKISGKQTDFLAWALLVLKERGSLQSLLGFSQVLTDAAGARGPWPVVEFYEDAVYPPLRLKQLRRLTERGLWSASLAQQQAGEGR